jgi:hypothetical protein
MEAHAHALGGSAGAGTRHLEDSTGKKGEEEGRGRRTRTAPGRKRQATRGSAGRGRSPPRRADRGRTEPALALALALLPTRPPQAAPQPHLTNAHRSRGCRGRWERESASAGGRWAVGDRLRPYRACPGRAAAGWWCAWHAPAAGRSTQPTPAPLLQPLPRPLRHPQYHPRPRPRPRSRPRPSEACKRRRSGWRPAAPPPSAGPAQSDPRRAGRCKGRGRGVARGGAGSVSPLSRDSGVSPRLVGQDAVRVSRE